MGKGPRRVLELLKLAAAEHPRNEAFVDSRQRLTYGEAASRVAAIARGLLRHGFRPGDRVLLWFDPQVEAALLVYAAAAAGAIAVPVHPTFKPAQVLAIARDCDARAIATTADRLSGIEAEASQSLLLIGVGPLPGSAAPTRPLVAFEELSEAVAGDLPQLEGSPDQLAMILYTSGSSGTPKGVMLSHANLLNSAEVGATVLEVGPQDRVLNIIPFSFIAGLGQLFYSSLRGATLVMMRFVVARAVVERMAEEKISVLGTVPLVWQLLARADSRLSEVSLPNLKCINSSGGAAPAEALHTVQRLVPAAKIQMSYGQTECQRITSLTLQEFDAHPGAAGRPLPGAHVALVDEQGKPVAPGEAGEIAVRGPRVALGYWNQPAFQAEGDERVRFTGDLGKVDADGFLHVLGRRDAMIKSYGHRVSRTSVEEVLLRHQGVESAAVIGIPDPQVGHRIKAFVVGRTGAPVSVGDLQRFCETHLPVHMVPRSIDLLEALPMTGNGKVDYQELSRRERR